jgi:hypothetical protein
MKQKNIPVVTPVGELYGRDAIFLDDVSAGRRVLILKGEINGRLTSIPQDRYIGYTLTFKGVIAFSMIELDACKDFGISSFDEILDSGWIGKIRASVERDVLNCSQLRHFFVQTYDDVFNVVCQTYELAF